MQGRAAQRQQQADHQPHPAVVHAQRHRLMPRRPAGWREVHSGFAEQHAVQAAAGLLQHPSPAISFIHSAQHRARQGTARNLHHPRRAAGRDAVGAPGVQAQPEQARIRPWVFTEANIDVMLGCVRKGALQALPRTAAAEHAAPCHAAGWPCLLLNGDARAMPTLNPGHQVCRSITPNCKRALVYAGSGAAAPTGAGMAAVLHHLERPQFRRRHLVSEQPRFLEITTKIVEGLLVTGKQLSKEPGRVCGRGSSHPFGVAPHWKICSLSMAEASKEPPTRSLFEEEACWACYETGGSSGSGSGCRAHFLHRH